MLVSAQPVVVTLFGGVASLWGPVIGAAILVPLSKLLDAYAGDYLRGIQGVVYGAAIIAIILAAPDGLFWTLRDRFFRRESRPRRSAAPAARRQGRRQRTRRPGTTLMSVEGLSHSFGGLRAVSKVSFYHRPGRDPRHHRSERRGQDDAVQRAERRAAGRRGHRDTRRRSRCSGKKVHQVCRMGVGRTFQVVRSFPRLPLLDNVDRRCLRRRAAGPGGRR